MIDFDFNEYCYGCGACEYSCHQHAIKLVANEEGFLMPSIDESLCINCGLCEKVCPRVCHPDAIDIKNSSAYYFYINDKAVRKNSTSGGAFYAIAKSVIQNGGVVAGCVWNENMEAVIDVADSELSLSKMRGSKYVQARIVCFDSLRNVLTSNKLVLFSGTPCQCAAVKNLFKSYQNLRTVALICEGVPSPMAWKKWIEHLEYRAGGYLVDATHRKKGRYGWLAPISEYSFSNGKKIENLSYTLDPYVRNMIYGYFTRNSCYSCQYKGGGSAADVIIGDYWGASNSVVKASKNAGCSVLVVNTTYGQELVSSIKERVTMDKITIEDASRNNYPLMQSCGKNGNRDEVLKSLSKNDYMDVINKYCGMNTSKMKAAWDLHKLHLAGIAKKMMRHIREKKSV